MEEKKIQTGLRLPPDQHKRFEAIANRTGATVNSIIAQAADIGLAYIEKGCQGLSDTEITPCSRS